MASISFVTIAISDLERSIGFYRSWLDLADDAIRHGGDHAALTLEGGLEIVLYPRDKVAEAAGTPVQPSSSEFILSRSAKDRDELKSILAEGEAAGGRQPSPMIEEHWGASGFILDLDEHLWEIVAFDD